MTRWMHVRTLSGRGVIVTTFGDKVDVEYTVNEFESTQDLGGPAGTRSQPTGFRRLAVEIDHDHQLRSTTARPLTTLDLILDDGSRLPLNITGTAGPGYISTVEAAGGLIAPQ